MEDAGRQRVHRASCVNVRGAGHRVFKDSGWGGGGYAPRRNRDTFLEVLLVLRRPLEAAFDTEEKTVSQALTG